VNALKLRYNELTMQWTSS